MPAAKLLKGLKSFGSSFLDFCLPRRCAGCQEGWLPSYEGLWCEACLEELPWIRSPHCPRCGRPFVNSPSSPDHLCGDCLLSSSPFDTARSATLHSGVVRDGIHQLKFGGQLHWLPSLVALLAKTLNEGDWLERDLVLPVPLHLRRLQQRGFNQAGLLAKGLANWFGLPLSFDVLVRKMWTEPQTRLNREARLKNVKDAFEVVHPQFLKGRKILLIDDVFTTGTTLGECAKTLKTAGALEVHALTVSRAIPDWKEVRSI